jgi:hypothetical protein
MHCEAQRCVAPFDGRSFARDFARELRRLADQHHCPPIFPQRLWFRALAAADAKDVDRSVQARNAADDDSYFQTQHICSLAAQLLHDFNTHHVHRSSSGEIRVAPQTDSYTLPPNAHDRYRRNYGDKVEPAAAAAATR